MKGGAILLIIIVGVLLYFVYFRGRLFGSNDDQENFSDSENKKIAVIFTSAQQGGKTYTDVKKQISSTGIDFYGTGDKPSFSSYYEMYKNYNKGTLYPSVVDQIRNTAPTKK
jgi:hypothetical protein